MFCRLDSSKSSPGIGFPYLTIMAEYVRELSNSTDIKKSIGQMKIAAKRAARLPASLLCVLDSRARVALWQAHVALGAPLVRRAEHAATVVRRHRPVSLCHVAVPVGDSAVVYGNIGKRPLAPPWRNDGLHQMPNVIGPTRRFMLGGGPSSSALFTI